MDLIQLKNFIQSKFASHSEFHCFAITKIEFNCNEINPELYIEIEHFKSESLKIQFNFKDFEFYSVTNESNSCHMEFETFYDFSFLSIGKKFNDNSINQETIEYKHPNTESLNAYRIICQNFMIDVFTDSFPEIIYEL